MTTRVKICGFRSGDQAEHAARAGADLIGINIWSPSPRSVSVEAAAAMAARLRALPSAPRIVLVVVMPDVAGLEEAVRIVGPDYLQVHGAWGDDVSVAGVPVIRGFSLGSAADVETIAAWPGELVIVDAKVEGMHGGTGRVVPGELLARVERPYLLAGGLRPETVAGAVRRFHPWAVDVASGVESAPGVKDPGAIESFIREVRSAHA